MQWYELPGSLARVVRHHIHGGPGQGAGMCRPGRACRQKPRLLGEAIHGWQEVSMWLSVKVSNPVYFYRSDSAMSRKGIGDRMKAKTNVATARLMKRFNSPIMGFQVLNPLYIDQSNLVSNLVWPRLHPARHHACGKVWTWCVSTTHGVCTYRPIGPSAKDYHRFGRRKH